MSEKVGTLATKDQRSLASKLVTNWKWALYKAWNMKNETLNKKSFHVSILTFWETGLCVYLHIFIPIYSIYTLIMFLLNWPICSLNFTRFWILWYAMKKFFEIITLIFYSYFTQWYDSFRNEFYLFHLAWSELEDSYIVLYQSNFFLNNPKGFFGNCVILGYSVFLLLLWGKDKHGGRNWDKVLFDNKILKKIS